MEAGSEVDRIPTLTLREQAYLGLLDLGASDACIGATLHLNPRQVQQWQRRLRILLRVQSREDLVAWVQSVPRGPVPKDGEIWHPCGMWIRLEQEPTPQPS